MSNELFNSLTTIALAIIGLGVIATLVSRNANTAGVLSAGGASLGSAITAAEGPVSGGGGFNLNGFGNGSGFQNF